MRVNDEGAVVLTKEERRALAHMLASHVLEAAHDNESLLWEDVPRLCERDWEAIVTDEIPRICRHLLHRGDEATWTNINHLWYEVTK